MDKITETVDYPIPIDYPLSYWSPDGRTFTVIQSKDETYVYDVEPAGHIENAKLRQTAN